MNCIDIAQPDISTQDEYPSFYLPVQIGEIGVLQRFVDGDPVLRMKDQLQIEGKGGKANPCIVRWRPVACSYSKILFSRHNLEHTW